MLSIYFNADVDSEDLFTRHTCHVVSIFFSLPSVPSGLVGVFSPGTTVQSIPPTTTGLIQL